jgi:hypothetical protein
MAEKGTVVTFSQYWLSLFLIGRLLRRRRFLHSAESKPDLYTDEALRYFREYRSG